MDIIAAIKSGKPFKRENCTSFYRPNYPDYILSPEDLLADDWIIEETKVEITESAYEAACDVVISYEDYMPGMNCYEFRRRLKQELFGKKEK